MSAIVNEAITLKDIQTARKHLANVAVVTPLLESAFINELAGRRVLIKAESLQRTGSFKFRGAWSALSSLDGSTRDKGVLAYSSGNHAQAIAHSAAMMGINAVIVMPSDAPLLKRQNTEAYGAEVVLYDRPGGEDREAIGAALAEERNLTLIKPYDNPHVMAGQGTCGLEIAEQAAAAGITSADVLVCCGGGGLTSGIALALEEAAPDLLARPVEPEGYDDVMRSLVSGQREFNTVHPESICDAIVTPAPGELTFPIMKRLCGEGLAVSDEDALKALAIAMMRLKVIAEPGGSVALAAALFQADKINGDAVICVLSGGNADGATLARALETLGARY